MSTFTIIFGIKLSFNFRVALDIKNSIPIYKERKLRFEMFFTEPFFTLVTKINLLFGRIAVLCGAFIAYA
jgi:hypothetical protein